MLSDKEQRAVYDEQGVVDEESDVLSQDRCWEDYWRLLFPKVVKWSRPKTVDTHRYSLYTSVKAVYCNTFLHTYVFYPEATKFHTTYIDKMLIMTLT